MQHTTDIVCVGGMCVCRVGGHMQCIYLGVCEWNDNTYTTMLF